MGHFRGADSSRRAILAKIERLEETVEKQNEDLQFRQCVAEIESWFEEKRRIYNSEEEKQKREAEYRRIAGIKEIGELRGTDSIAFGEIEYFEEE